MKKAPAKMMKKSAAKLKAPKTMPLSKMTPAQRKKFEEFAKKEKAKAPTKMKKAPAKFNAKLKAASAAGKLSGKFKAAVDASPAKMKKMKDSAAKMKKAAMKLKKESSMKMKKSMAMLKKSMATMKKASAMKMKMEKSAVKMKKAAGKGGAKLMSKARLAKIQKGQEERRLIKGVEKTRAKELARKRKPKPGGALKMKKSAAKLDTKALKKEGKALLAGAKGFATGSARSISRGISKAKSEYKRSKAKK